MLNTLKNTAPSAEIYRNELKEFYSWLDKEYEVANNDIILASVEEMLSEGNNRITNSYDDGVILGLSEFMRIADTAAGLFTVQSIALAVEHGLDFFTETEMMFKAPEFQNNNDTRRANREILRGIRCLKIANPVTNPQFYYGDGNGKNSSIPLPRSFFYRPVRTLFAFMQEISILDKFIDYVTKEFQDKTYEDLIDGVNAAVQLVIHYCEQNKPAPADNKAVAERVRNDNKFPFGSGCVGAAFRPDRNDPASWQKVYPSRTSSSDLVKGVGEKISSALDGKCQLSDPVAVNGYMFFMSSFRRWLNENRSVNVEDVRNMLSYLKGGVERVYFESLPLSPKAVQLSHSNIKAYVDILGAFLNPGSLKLSETGRYCIISSRTAGLSLVNQQLLLATSVLVRTGAIWWFPHFSKDAEKHGLKETEYVRRRDLGVECALKEVCDMLEITPVYSDTINKNVIDNISSFTTLLSDIVKAAAEQAQ